MFGKGGISVLQTSIFLQDTQVDGKKEEISFGTAAEFKPDMVPKKALVIDPTKLAHPSVRLMLVQIA